jgi:hypothetical protein
MANETTVLVSNITSEAVDSAFVYSDKAKGAGYHKFNDSLHTYNYVVDSFVGTIKLQGTLELFPGDDDWVDIDTTVKNGHNDSSIFQSGAISGNFTGRFVWIRAGYNLENGTITSIRINQ